MALFGVEQDHTQPDTLSKVTGCALNTPDQASGEWDWSYSLLHRGRCKAFLLHSGVVADHSLPDQMSTYETNYFSETDRTEQNEYEERGDACRRPSCHSRIHVRDVITEQGSVTLCRYCRKHLLGASS